MPLQTANVRPSSIPELPIRLSKPGGVGGGGGGVGGGGGGGGGGWVGEHFFERRAS